jgi:hypothetical protein
MGDLIGGFHGNHKFAGFAYIRLWGPQSYGIGDYKHSFLAK